MYGEAASGERGEKLSPSHADTGRSEIERPPVATGSAESSDLSSRGIRGVTSIRCAWCKGQYVPDQPEGTYHKDSDGMCPKCLEAQLPTASAGAAPVDAERDYGKTQAFLISLGLWSLPGGFWVVLFVPYALMALGGGR